MIKGDWLVEHFTPYEKHSYKIKKVLIDTETKFQKVLLLDLESYKKSLVLDGELQSTELDEFIYHESIVHPAMILHPNPERILILGGGEGATLREVLKHKSVKEVVMLDIDGEVIDFCKEYLDMFHKGSFFDHRVNLVITDARDYILKENEKFDVIISDLCCPIENSPACMLYTSEFYSVLKTRLNKNGMFLAQSGPADIPQFGLFSSIYCTLKNVFKDVYPFSSLVPSFIVPWGFNLAITNVTQNPMNILINEVDKLLEFKLKNNDLRYYDGMSHLKMFNMSKHLRNQLISQKNIITNDKPFYLFK
ncbi:fused MFS/spermidine synthase [bacterium]